MSKGDDTRRRIVSEAAKLFNRQGFAGAAMSDLMQATGLEKGGIYRHFPSKQELAAEAFDYAWQVAWDSRTAELKSIPNSVDRLKRFVRNFVDKRPAVPGGCPLLNTAIDADDGDPILRERALKALRGWRRTVNEIVMKGIERKEIRPSVDPKKLAALLISSLEGALMMSRLEKNNEALLAIQSHLESYLEEQVRFSR
jgi:TetR/AcrR family transcriptional repressor of nem operon